MLHVTQPLFKRVWFIFLLIGNTVLVGSLIISDMDAYHMTDQLVFGVTTALYFAGPALTSLPSFLPSLPACIPACQLLGWVCLCFSRHFMLSCCTLGNVVYWLV